ILLFVPLLFSCVEGDDNNVSPSDARDDYIGDWDVTESCSKDSYSVQIVADANNNDRVLIKSFWHITNQETPPYALIDGDIITIPKQFIMNDGSLEVHGTGTLNKKKITWFYEINDGADLYSCSATYEKK
ncbi:MAG: hypothetical protein GXO89_12955, partial [Chlorobi bacterium]|nr:hypothetical protein [Chlorobiota bacterium]